MDIKKDILWRVYLIYGFMCLFGLAILLQVAKLQLVQGDYWKNKADSLTTSYKNIEAIRGNIYAADGSLLATSIPTYEIRMDVRAGAITREMFDKNIDSLSLCLANMFTDKTAKEYRQELRAARQESERYLLIQRTVSYTQLKQMRKWPLFRLGKYKGGLIAIQKNRREKPFRLLAARTIGYDMDGIKPVGLEGSYAEYLKGVGGKRLMQKLSGNVWLPINDENEIEPKDGSDLVTTIDVNIQDVAESALLTQLSKNNADHGCAILMEVETGEIKAIANLSRDAITGQYNEFYNYAIGESTEPGSTFKLASLIAAMDDGYIDLDDTVNTENGSKKYYDRVMRDSHEGGYGRVSVLKAFEVSSNVGISNLIVKHYAKNPQAFVDHLNKMGLNQPLGLQIAGEAPPLIKNTTDKSWSGTTLPWMSTGYEVQLTPLQILNFYNAVANNGKMIKPMFVREIRQRGHLIKRFDTVVMNDSICSYSTVVKAKKMLEGVVENGTAKNLKNSNYKIAGKTGTAQIANSKYGYRYNTQTSYQASFVGYFPADNPKYSCIVVVYSPSNDVYYGNLVAGPIFKEIADKVYATRLEIHKELTDEFPIAGTRLPETKIGYRKDLEKIFAKLDVKSTTNNETAEWVTVSRNDSSLALKEKKIKSGIVPNVMGMGLKDALYILENAGLQVKINGRGIVGHQSIQPGSSVIKGNLIILDLT